MVTYINAWSEGLLNGLTPPSTKSPSTDFRPPPPRAILIFSGSKKRGAAVDARTTCQSGYAEFAIVLLFSRTLKYLLCGLFEIGHGLPVLSRLVTTKRPVCNEASPSVV